MNDKSGFLGLDPLTKSQIDTSQISRAEIIQHISKYAHNPIRWSRDVCGFEPDVWQAKAMIEFVERRFCAWSAGSGVGKTCILAILILFFLSTRAYPKIVCTAPSLHQLNDVLWAEINKWMGASKFLSKNFKWTATKVSLKGNEGRWFAVARTAKPSTASETSAVEGLQGMHEGNILVVCDEASGVPNQVMGAIEGSLTTKGACAILASNPTRKTGLFYKIITDPRYQEDWCVRTISAIGAKHVDQAAIRRVVRTWGVHSDYYRVKVLGLPPLVDAQALCSPEQLFEAHERVLSREGPTVISCDPARYGGDPCKFYVRKGMTIVDSEVVHSMDTQQVAKILVDLIEKHDPDKVYVDSIGIGAGVVDAARKLLKIRKHVIHEIAVSEKSSKPDKYMNRRAELFWNMRVLIDYISIPEETEFLDEELTTIQYKWNNLDTKIRIQSKDEIRALLRRSPNDADALILVFYDELLEKKMVKVSAKHFYVGAGSKNGIPEERQDLKNATKHPNGSITVVKAPVFGPSGGNPYGVNKNVNAAFSFGGRVGKKRFDFMKPSW